MICNSVPSAACPSQKKKKKKNCGTNFEQLQNSHHRLHKSLSPFQFFFLKKKKKKSYKEFQ